MQRFRSYIRSHKSLSIATAAVATLVLGAGAAYGVVDSSGSSSPTTTTVPTTTVPASGHAAKAHQPRGVRGQLTAISGSTWTVQTNAGKAVTVTITASTQFGTRKSPATASSFKVGDRIIVVGTRQGKAVTATRIALAPKQAGNGSPTTTTTIPAAA